MFGLKFLKDWKFHFYSLSAIGVINFVFLSCAIFIEKWFLNTQFLVYALIILLLSMSGVIQGILISRGKFDKKCIFFGWIISLLAMASISFLSSIVPPIATVIISIFVLIVVTHLFVNLANDLKERLND